ncbi:MAG: monophosphatase, partial [Frankiaceae bacterium]|nr:monophosphatase [Frankiaceae bacterium]
RATQAQVLTRVLPQVRDVRRFGSAAIDLCHVAEAVVDVYYERGLNPWDLAAGGLIAQEAGVQIGGLDGASAGVDLVIAAPPQLWGPLTDILDGDPRPDRD